jgi:hypothetical protein
MVPLQLSSLPCVHQPPADADGRCSVATYPVQTQCMGEPTGRTSSSGGVQGGEYWHWEQSHVRWLLALSCTLMTHLALSSAPVLQLPTPYSRAPASLQRGWQSVLQSVLSSMVHPSALRCVAVHASSREVTRLGGTVATCSNFPTLCSAFQMAPGRLTSQHSGIQGLPSQWNTRPAYFF